MAVLPSWQPASAGRPLPGDAGAQTHGYARDVTRYLCAAVQTDADLNRRLLDGTIDEPRRAIASSPGVDLVTVLRYGLAARARRHTTDAFLAVLVLAMLLLIVLGPMWIGLLAGPVLLLAWGIVLAENLTIYYGTLARWLRRDVFDPGNAPSSFPADVEQRLAEIAAQDRGNVTVFPAYSPFVGHGPIVKTWSMSLNVAQPAVGRSVTPFTVEELYEHTMGRVRALDLPGVVTDNRVLVNGDDLLHHVDPQVATEILPDRLARPRSVASDRLVRRLLSESRGRARSYLRVRVTGWSGELVLSVFVRYTMPPKGDLLFAEASYTLLTPPKEKYREVDRLLSSPTVGQLFRLAGRSARQAPVRLFSSLGLLAAPLAPLASWLKERREVRQISTEQSFNYGARVCARELAGDNLYFRYFQQLDKEMYQKMVERRILDAIEEFLEAHGVDTADFSARQTTILNNGIFVTDRGTLNARDVAAGIGARIGDALKPGGKGGTPA